MGGIDDSALLPGGVLYSGIRTVIGVIGRAWVAHADTIKADTRIENARIATVMDCVPVRVLIVNALLPNYVDHNIPSFGRPLRVESSSSPTCRNRRKAGIRSDRRVLLAKGAKAHEYLVAQFRSGRRDDLGPESAVAAAGAKLLSVNDAAGRKRASHG